MKIIFNLKPRDVAKLLDDIEQLAEELSNLRLTLSLLKEKL